YNATSPRLPILIFTMTTTLAAASVLPEPVVERSCIPSGFQCGIGSLCCSFTCICESGCNGITGGAFVGRCE
ncbi:hypothetical protein CPB84DRAFT_1789954, partial [Gymnopilus junonius]